MSKLLTYTKLARAYELGIQDAAEMVYKFVETGDKDAAMNWYETFYEKSSDSAKERVFPKSIRKLKNIMREE